MTLTELADKMEALSFHIPIAAGNVKKDVARTILHDLTQVTPADTGAAIANWQATVGLPTMLVLPPFIPSPRGRMVGGKWTHTVDPEVTARANMPPTFEAGSIAIEGATPGEPVFIASLLPYIQYLDQGTSDQQPAGFVDRAIILGRYIVEQAKLL